jgi:hypothetical protein
MHSTNKPPPECPGRAHAERTKERLCDLILLAGIPLASNSSQRELQLAMEQLRKRRRDELMLFLGRLIARDIHERPNHTQGNSSAQNEV